MNFTYNSDINNYIVSYCSPIELFNMELVSTSSKPADSCWQAKGYKNKEHFKQLVLELISFAQSDEDRKFYKGNLLSGRLSGFRIKEIFPEGIKNFSIQLTDEKFNYYKSLDIVPVDPETKEPTSNFNLFLHRLSVCKWKCMLFESPLEPYEILGLNKDFSDIEIYRSLRKMQFVLHPDKNPDNQKQATMLCQVFNNMKEEIIKDLNTRNG